MHVTMTLSNYITVYGYTHLHSVVSDTCIFFISWHKLQNTSLSTCFLLHTISLLLSFKYTRAIIHIYPTAFIFSQSAENKETALPLSADVYQSHRDPIHSYHQWLPPPSALPVPDFYLNWQAKRSLSVTSAKGMTIHISITEEMENRYIRVVDTI